MLSLLGWRSLGGPKSCTSRTWISVDFLLPGDDGFPWREDQAGVITDSMLGATVLKGMKTNDAESTADANAVGYPPQGSLERSKFLVDRDPKGLKRTSCRMNFFTAEGRVNIADQGGQVDCTLQGLFSAVLDNPGGDPSTQTLLAKGKQKVGNMILAKPFEKAPCRFSLGRIKTQVKRTGGMKTEAAFVVRKLVAGKTKVQQDGIHVINIELVEDLRDM